MSMYPFHPPTKCVVVFARSLSLHSVELPIIIRLLFAEVDDGTFRERAEKSTCAGIQVRWGRKKLGVFSLFQKCTGKWVVVVGSSTTSSSTIVVERGRSELNECGSDSTALAFVFFQQESLSAKFFDISARERKRNPPADFVDSPMKIARAFSQRAPRFNGISIGTLHLTLAD